MNVAVFLRRIRLLAAAGALVQCLSVSSETFAAGGAGVSGGDDCEQRFKEVASDVRKWVLGGGPKYLDHAKCGSTEENFTKKMKAATERFKVNCVTKDDPPEEDDEEKKPVWPVQVNGTPKLCINWMDKGVLRFRCDFNKFYKNRPTPTNDSGQYRLVHHEFAAIAGLEPTGDDDSNYCYSDQLEGFLENKKVLAIGPKKETDAEFKLDRIVKAPEKRYRDPECSKVINAVTAYERKPGGKDLKRVEITETVCIGQQAREYYIKIYGSDGRAVYEQKGLGMGDGLRQLGQKIPEQWLRVQGLYREFTIQGKDCQFIKVNSETAEISGYGDCPKKRSSELPPEPNSIPLDNGLAPAA